MRADSTGAPRHKRLGQPQGGDRLPGPPTASALSAWVGVPMSGPSHGIALQNPRCENAGVTTPYSTAPRALIADDQPEVLEALRLLLKGEGFHPFTVTSPDAVVQQLMSQHFDVLLMDLNYARDTTSGQEGLDLLSRIQAIDGTLPVIVMTGWGSVEVAVEAMRRGVRDFVQKPWENSRLISVLRTHTEQGQVLRKGRRLAAARKALSRELMACEDAHALVRTVAARVQEIFGSRAATVFTRAPMDQAYWATAQMGLSDEILGKLKFEPECRLVQQLVSTVQSSGLDLPEGELARLRRAQAHLVAPVRIKGDLVAFIGLGERQSDEQYDAEDLKFLTEVGEDTGAGIESLRLKGKEREYEEAREIQQGLLPKTIPQIPGHEILRGMAAGQHGRRRLLRRAEILRQHRRALHRGCRREGHARGAPHVEPPGRGEGFRIRIDAAQRAVLEGQPRH